MVREIRGVYRRLVFRVSGGDDGGGSGGGGGKMRGHENVEELHKNGNTSNN